jgi:hypothetical protein
MMIGTKKSVFCVDFKNSITFLYEKMSPEKVNIKELQPLCFTPFSSSVTLFCGVLVVRHAILLTTKVASSLRLSGTR